MSQPNLLPPERRREGGRGRGREAREREFGSSMSYGRHGLRFRSTMPPSFALEAETVRPLEPIFLDAPPSPKHSSTPYYLPSLRLRSRPADVSTLRLASRSVFWFVCSSFVLLFALWRRWIFFFFVSLPGRSGSCGTRWPPVRRAKRKGKKEKGRGGLTRV